MASDQEKNFPLKTRSGKLLFHPTGTKTGEARKMWRGGWEEREKERERDTGEVKKAVQAWMVINYQRPLGCRRKLSIRDARWNMKFN